MKKISAIVVNWNGKEVLSGCLRSLLNQDYEDVEILVVDNGSEDGSQALVKKEFPSVKLVENEANLGFGPAVNKGFEKAEGDCFIFLNNDLALQPDCLRQLAKLLDSDPTVGAAIPKILYYSLSEKNVPKEPARINSYGVLINYTGIACPNLINQFDQPDLPLTESACGGIFMLPREVYEKVGGFDDDLFLYHEDHDLSWRIRMMGWKLMVVPDSVCYHHYNFNKGVLKFYRSEKNRLHILLKNFECKTLCLIAPAIVLVEMSQIVHALFHGWFFLKLKSYWEIAAQSIKISRKRRQIQFTRKVTDKEIVRLHQDIIAVTELKNPLVDYFLNPILKLYWICIRGLI
ncbi:MAG TPA: glycosyltransferase family 2 protein [Nitrospinae bacterium]|jgi:GT2 family glycosyltransferase|nr:glycosyltransferase family 2 protein [Nitrospinota bacterium]